MISRTRDRSRLVSCTLFLCAALAAPHANAINLPFTATMRIDLAVDRAAVPFVLSAVRAWPWSTDRDRAAI